MSNQTLRNLPGPLRILHPSHPLPTLPSNQVKGKVLQLGVPARGRGLDRMVFEGPFQPKPLCESHLARHEWAGGHAALPSVSWMCPDALRQAPCSAGASLASPQLQLLSPPSPSCAEVRAATGFPPRGSREKRHRGQRSKERPGEQSQALHRHPRSSSHAASPEGASHQPELEASNTARLQLLVFKEPSALLWWDQAPGGMYPQKNHCTGENGAERAGHAVPEEGSSSKNQLRPSSVSSEQSGLPAVTPPSRTRRVARLCFQESTEPAPRRLAGAQAPRQLQIAFLAPASVASTHQAEVSSYNLSP